jgi:hypothetical protein
LWAHKDPDGRADAIDNDVADDENGDALRWHVDDSRDENGDRYAHARSNRGLLQLSWNAPGRVDT